MVLKRHKGDFPGGPVVKTPHFHSRGTGSVPGRGTKILHAAWPKKKNRERERETERERQRETERQRDRETERDRDRLENRARTTVSG